MCARCVGIVHSQAVYYIVCIQVYRSCTICCCRNRLIHRQSQHAVQLEASILECVVLSCNVNSPAQSQLAVQLERLQYFSVCCSAAAYASFTTQNPLARHSRCVFAISRQEGSPKPIPYDSLCIVWFVISCGCIVRQDRSIFLHD